MYSDIEIIEKIEEEIDPSDFNVEELTYGHSIDSI